MVIVCRRLKGIAFASKSPFRQSQYYMWLLLLLCGYYYMTVAIYSWLVGWTDICLGLNRAAASVCGGIRWEGISVVILCDRIR